MVRPSNPKLMQHVLDAVFHLNEAKGSTSLAIQDYVQKFVKSKKSSVLRLQVQRALKHAVNASLLKFLNGRYKAQLILKPTRKLPKPMVADTLEDLLPDNYNQDDEDINDLTIQLRDRPSRSKRSTSRSGKRPSKSQRGRKPRRRGVAGTKVSIKNQRTDKLRKRVDGKKSKRNPSGKELSETNLSDLSDIADLLNSSSSKTSHTTKQNDGNDSDTQSDISTSQQNNTNNNNDNNNNPGRNTATPAKTEPNKPKPTKASELVLDDSDYEPSQHQPNDRELSEETDMNQIEDIVDS